ncbi:MAG: HlyD family efflux transporter periplasmic adaptor subunit [Bacteroidota bacterium]
MKKIRIILGIPIFWLLLSCGGGVAVDETKPILKDITETVFASGTLATRTTYQLTARTEGYLQEIAFEENDFVQKGAVVAVVDNDQNNLNARSGTELYEFAKENLATNAPQLQQARNAIAQAKQTMEYDLKQLERYKALLEANTIAKIAYENVELKYQNSKIAHENATQYYDQLKRQAEEQVLNQKAQKDLTSTVKNFNRVIALQSGSVLKKYKYTGEYVRPGEIIATIGEVQDLYATINIDESSIKKVRLNQKVFIQLNVDKEKDYTGFVQEILPTFDNTTQSFIGKVEFEDSLDFNYIGTQLQVNIVVDSVQNALLIPRRFLNFANEVRVKGEEKPRQIATKLISNEWVQVLSGIDTSTVLMTQKVPSI